MQCLALLLVATSMLGFGESMKISDLRKVLKELEKNRHDFLYAFEYGWSADPPVYDYDIFSTVPVLYY